MRVVNMLDAKTNLSKLVDAVESGSESEVIIARNGRPAARLVPVSEKPAGTRRLGLLEGKYPPMSLEDFNALDEEIARLFYGEDE
jgi:prevent-host-death family protein